jgi:hypothetical protein
MQPDANFTQQPSQFWAYVKLLSEQIGYSERKTKSLRKYSIDDMTHALVRRGLSVDDVLIAGSPTDFGKKLVEYLNLRATLLEEVAEPNLMNRDQARELFEDLKKKLNPTCALPMNKQKGEKRHYSFLTCIVNMLTEATLGGCDFDMDPHGLVTVTKNTRLLRTLSRRLDGAYPNINNPVAVWEIKEYYGTTTFGSRVADGVYETTVDGLELMELLEHEGIQVAHYLIVDDYFTWWQLGKSYLCRIVDMLHMGFLSEVLFGREVVDRWPQIVKSWRSTK